MKAEAEEKKKEEQVVSNDTTRNNNMYWTDEHLNFLEVPTVCVFVNNTTTAV